MAFSVIAEGNLKTSGSAFQVRELGMDDIDDMLSLQEAVRQTMENPATLEVLTEEEFEYILSDHGFMIGIYVEERLVAFRAMLIPTVDDPEHLGADAGLQQEELDQVIYSEITVVHPFVRGNGLQTYMGEIVFEKVNKEQFPYIAATVAPFNIPSLKDKLALGMEIVALEKKYNGKLRYVFFKDYLQQKPSSVAETKWEEMSDTNAQQQLMQAGYRGVGLEQLGDTYQVVYKR